MKNRDKYITKVNEHDLMMVLAKRGCPIAIVTGKRAYEIDEWQKCDEACEGCVQNWLNKEGK